MERTFCAIYFECLSYQWHNISIYIFIYMKTLIPHRIFRFWNFVLLKQKFRKQKCQCSQKMLLNPTCVKLSNTPGAHLIRIVNLRPVYSVWYCTQMTHQQNHMWILSSSREHFAHQAAHCIKGVGSIKSRFVTTPDCWSCYIWVSFDWKFVS